MTKKNKCKWWNKCIFNREKFAIILESQDEEIIKKYQKIVEKLVNKIEKELQ